MVYPPCLNPWSLDLIALWANGNSWDTYGCLAVCCFSITTPPSLTPSSHSLVILWAPNILMLCLMSMANCSWDAETTRTGLGLGGSDIVPGESNEELYSLIFSCCSLLVQIESPLLPLPLLVLMVLSSCEHLAFASYILWAHKTAHESQRPWEQA